MLTLLTTLALNIPGNPEQFYCTSLADHENTCIVWTYNKPTSAPDLIVTYECVGAGPYWEAYNTKIKIFPNAGILEVQNSGNLYKCLVTTVEPIVAIPPVEID
tara:strand:- start:300 stop:608 length:309 start_codon:yes stop_codon:yes gene_type:complete